MLNRCTSIAPLMRTLTLGMSLVLIVGCVTNTTTQIQHPPDVSSRVDNPRICLALSGGGLRAGTVALGVLQELHLADYLRKIDIVASVSGGGYPVYGLVMRMEKDGEKLSNLLHPNSEYLENVRSTPLINFSEATSIVGVTGLATAIFSPIKLLSGLEEVGLANSASPLYAEAVQDTFYKPRWGHLSSFFLKNVNPRRLERQGFPYPIFVTAAKIGQSPPRADHQYDVGDLFELSPKWAGSESLGYVTPAPALMHIWQAMVASAAAPDAPHMSNGVWVNGHTVRPDPRIRDENKDPPRSSKGTKGLPDVLKALYIGMGIPVRPQREPMYLSDGGFIENLAIMPLLRLGCKEIISVDSEADPDFDLINLNVLTKYIQHMDGKADWPLKLKKISKHPDQGWQTHNEPFKIEVRFLEHEANIHLLKLSLHKEKISEYPNAVRSYFAEAWEKADRKLLARLPDHPQPVVPEPQNCGKLDELLGSIFPDRHPFPFAHTFQLCYEHREADAYIELGRFMACGYLESEGLECSVKPNIE